MKQERFEQLILEVTAEVAPQEEFLSRDQKERVKQLVIGRASVADADENVSSSLDEYHRYLDNAGLALD